MQSNFLSTTLLPIALGIIMLGLGLALSIDDFKRVIKYPKAVAIALICQMVLLPAICFFVAKIFGLEPALAVGLMLLAASPGGATANLYSHLSDGDVALNITLTAVNSVLTLFTLPLVVNFSLSYFMTSDQYVPMQFSKVAEVFAIVLVPVTLGMLVKSKLPAFATKMDKPVKILSAVFLILIIIAAVYRERVILTAHFGTIGFPVLVFNLLSMGLGYYLPQVWRVEKKQAIAIGMEIGIHNGTLAIFIALSVLNNSLMSVPAALYSLFMFFTAALFGYLVKKNKV
ncbi:MAG: bile acid:sodium symporter family protein [Cytophagales bacterium]|jgi:BASS family bile acid:Na+ symporter|nr:bile acid:sodium symporter family protein [Cytophagales bacterium]MCA6388521.1 bile acid:sodium symporter family protein [Cytophagales bacterium]MCA6390802.1 bile acid:sodium symporter family protein [Cytophagales bacterium]MCA6396337.1 bile acid:sodium symporter family protein [Cytophagales bacterium]MCA6399768.1 bile acid:sodium symporter family protein [Cytophagales bacterium]